LRLEKLYYRIGEVAGLVGVEPHVLRYWESEFRSIRPQKSAKGQRIYSRRDVETLQKVKELLYAHKFTIAGARQKLREGGVEPAPQPERAVAKAAVETQAPVALDELKALHAELCSAREAALRFLEELDRI
jgi:DNA-binding transcriptional MerR regulator